MTSLQAGYLHRLWGMRPGNILSGPPRAVRLLIHLPRTHTVYWPQAIPTARR